MGPTPLSWRRRKPARRGRGPIDVVRTLRALPFGPTSGRSAPGGPPARRGPCFLYKKAGGKNRRAPPCTRSLKPLAGARSIFCVCALCTPLFLAHVHQTRFGYAYSEKNFSLDLALQKIQPKKISQKKVPKSGHVHGSRKRPATALLRLPTQKPERASSERFYIRGCRGEPPATLCVRAFS